MQYGLTFVVDMYDFEMGEELHVVTMPGDYIRMTRWAKEYLDPGDGEMVTNLRRNYACAWQALRRQGRLGELELPEELTAEAVDAMADRFSIYVNDMEDGSLPTRQGRAK